MVSLLDTLARPVRQLLRRIPECATPLSGDLRGAMEKALHPGRVPALYEDWPVLSADLRTATDLLHRDAVEAVVEGILNH